MVGGGHRRRCDRGFTYLWVLLAIALVGVGLTAVSQVWVTTAQRQKADELEWIGAQFVQAIGSYYESSPGFSKTFPSSVQDMLEDRRSAVVRRHLRSAYRNPFTARDDWQLLLTADGKIRGVRALVNDAGVDRSRDFVFVPSFGR